MKQFSLLLSLLILLNACRKTGGDPNPEPPPVDYTPVPAPSSVTTGLGMYSPGNSQSGNPIFLNVQGTDIPYSNASDGFHIASINADKYNTRVAAQIALTANYPGYLTYRTLTTLPALKNYGEIYPKFTDHIATLFDTESGTYPVPGGGLISIPVNAFTPGTSVFSVSGYYLHPQVTGYAVSLPCYPMGDESQKRSYLESYGITFLQTYCADNQGYTVNFKAGADIKLKMPIHPAQLASAPDTIPAWNLGNDGKWLRNGYALKSNGYYEKRIDKKGYWNFAKTVNGVYVTLHLKNSLGIPVPNTRFRIKEGTSEIADGRTNSNGDALIFVPTGKALTIILTNDHFNNWLNAADPVIPFGTYTYAGEKTVTIPARIDLVTLEGNVFNCDGSPFPNGTATLINTNAKDDYVIPVTNGKFRISNWINYAYNMADLVIKDNNGAILNTYKLLLGSANAADYKPLIKDYKLNFYTCPDANRVYMHYRIDNTSFSIGEDGTNTAMTGNNSQLNITVNGAGVNFKGWFTTIGGNYFLNDLKINGVTCTFDDAKGWSEIFITRNDPNPGGFMEGWYSVNYKDPAGVSRNINGNFRVKKVP